MNCLLFTFVIGLPWMFVYIFICLALVQNWNNNRNFLVSVLLLSCTRLPDTLTSVLKRYLAHDPSFPKCLLKEFKSFYDIVFFNENKWPTSRILPTYTSCVHDYEYTLKGHIVSLTFVHSFILSLYFFPCCFIILILSLFFALKIYFHDCKMNRRISKWTLLCLLFNTKIKIQEKSVRYLVSRLTHKELGSSHSVLTSKKLNELKNQLFLDP